MKFPIRLGHKQEELDYNEKSWLLLDTDITPIRYNRGILSSCFSYACDPNCRPYRYLIAILLSCVLGIISYCTEIPGGIQATTIRVMKLDNTQYNMIYTAFTWPDIVMSVLGSITVNRFLGVRVGFIVFTVLLLLGQTLCSIGTYVNSFLVFLLGRVLLGSGTGTSTSIVNSFAVLWFEGKEIAFILSLVRTMSRSGATLALITPQLAYDALDLMVSPYNRLGTTQMVGTVLCFMCVCCAVAVVMLDKRGAKFIGRKPYGQKQISITGILHFPISYWTVVMICSLYYAMIISFTGNGPLFFESKYGLSTVMANLANSLSYTAVIVVAPFLGLLIDFSGYNLLWGLLGVLLAVVSNVILFGGEGSNQLIPFLAAILNSISFTFFGNSMWVCVSFLVPKHQVTTAYGIAMSVYSLTLTITGLIAGVIIEHLGYLVLGILYLSMLCFAICCGVLLSLSELFSEGKKVLNISGKQRRKRT